MGHTDKCRKRCPKASAPAFAKRLSSLIKNRLDVSHRKVASALQLDPAAVHRLCTTGAGSEDNVCKILKYLHLKRRRILEILAARRAELSDGEAHELWKDFRYAFPDAREYMAELCPFPLQTVCACTRSGISIQNILDLARNAKIKATEDLTELKPSQLFPLFEALSREYGKDKAKTVFSSKADPRVPLVAHLDTFHQRDAGAYVALSNCRGKLLFGIPHVIVTHYVFGTKGEIGAHGHAGGAEFLYSEQGEFLLECGGIRYPRPLRDDGSVIVLDGRRHHSIRLAIGEIGRLLVVRYDPRRRSLSPGPTLAERARRQEAGRRRKANAKGRSAQTP